MDQKRSQRLEALYDFALDLPAEERSAYLAEACSDDAELRNRVESLLAESESRGDLLSKPILTRGLSILAREQVILLHGDQLGPYKIVKLLGRGGMGEVYLAQDPRLGRLVAIKLLPTPLNGQGLSVMGLEQEARAASSVSHPNVAHIYEIGEADGHRYIAMEYVEGNSLRALLSRKVLGVNEAVEIALQITNALGAAHAAGIAHRDIKPENIIVRSDGYVKVLDFGLAKLTEVKDRKTARAQKNPDPEGAPRIIMGTTAYMSPEQVRGEETDARTDFWSLGVLLYEMLTEGRPFVGETPNDIATAILTINPQPLKSDSEPMASLALITQKALTKSINGRYQTSTDFAKDLNRIKQYLQAEDHVSSSTNRHPLFDSGFGKALFSVEKFLHLTHPGAVSEGPRTWISWGMKAGFAGLFILIAVFAGIYVRRLDDARSTSSISQTSGTISQPNPKIKSLVILPFQNDTGDDNFNYVTNGLTEDVSRNLSRSRSLIIIDRYSAEHVSKKDFSQIKQLLDVDAALQCRIGIKGSELVVQPNLVNLGTGEVIWQNSFTVGRDDLLGLRKLLTGMITINLQGLLGEDKAFIFDKHFTKNPAAYNAYLEGRFFADKHDISNLERSIPLLEKATQLDQDFALAYVALGNSYNLLGTWLGQSPDEYKRKSQEAILKAIALDKDKTLAEAHTALAKLKMDYDHDWTGVDEEFRRAIEINPGYALAHHWYGEVYLSAMGRLEESLAELQLAHRLDPLHTGTVTAIAWTYIGAHQYEKAIEECRKAQAMDSPDPKYQDASIYENWAKALMKLGRFDEAINNAKKACELDHTGNNCAKVGAMFGWAGRKTEALEVLQQLQSDPSQFGGVSYYDLAIIEASLGEKDKAFELLDKEFYSNSVDLLSIKIDPMLDSLRDDPRFTELERRYNFPLNSQAR